MGRLPSFSQFKPAVTATNMFQICRMPLIRFWVSVEVTETGFNIRFPLYHETKLTADGVQNLVEVVRDQAVAGPLREEGKAEDDSHAPTVTRSLHERSPANVGLSCLVAFNCSLDFVEFVGNEWILAGVQLVCKLLDHPQVLTGCLQRANTQ